MKARIAALILLVIAVIVLIAYYQYNRPHRNVDDEKAIALAAAELYQAFDADETKANQLYLDKVVEVKGAVDQISSNQEGKTVVVLRSENPMAGIACTLRSTSPDVHIGDVVTIKGICTGYLQDVVITDVSIVLP